MDQAYVDGLGTSVWMRSARCTWGVQALRDVDSGNLQEKRTELLGEVANAELLGRFQEHRAGRIFLPAPEHKTFLLWYGGIGGIAEGRWGKQSSGRPWDLVARKDQGR